MITANSGSGAVALDRIEITGGHETEETGIFAPSSGVTLSLSHDLIDANTGDGFTGSPDGFAGRGGAVYCEGTLQLTDTDVVNNHTLGGVGLGVESPARGRGVAAATEKAAGSTRPERRRITGGQLRRQLRGRRSRRSGQWDRQHPAARAEPVTAAPSSSPAPAG